MNSAVLETRLIPHLYIADLDPCAAHDTVARGPSPSSPDFYAPPIPHQLGRARADLTPPEVHVT
jgi:hypothetical protein